MCLYFTAHIETIKSVMKGITLPTCSLPEWASVVPEEEWKATLLSEMHTRSCKVKERHGKTASHKNKLDLMNNEALR